VSQFASGKTDRGVGRVRNTRRHKACSHTEAGATTLLGVRSIVVATTMSTGRTASRRSTFLYSSSPRLTAAAARRSIAERYKGYLLLPKSLSTTTSRRFGENLHETGLIGISGVNGVASMFTTMK